MYFSLNALFKKSYWKSTYFIYLSLRYLTATEWSQFYGGKKQGMFYDFYFYINIKIYFIDNINEIGNAIIRKTAVFTKDTDCKQL